MITTIKIKDNHASRELSAAEVDKLLPLAGVGLNWICENIPSLLLFPNCLGDYGDNLSQPLYSMVGNRITVGNLVGFLGIGDIHIRILSRFDSDEKQYFFHYMLQRVSGVNVLDLPTYSNFDNVWDLLVYLFPRMLKLAMRQGVFRTYRVFRYDDERVKGAIDISRYIRHDMPFSGRISYTTREYTADNYVMHLIRHTIEYIRCKWPDLLSIDMETRKAVDMVVHLTPDFSGRSRNMVVAANLRPLRHPYYTSYSGLQKLCLQILRHDGLSFSSGEDTVCGVVFDCAWLWEEYLATILESMGFCHAVCGTSIGKRAIFAGDVTRSEIWNMYPDFYSEGRGHVLDAKYKAANAKREDILQVLAYVLNTGAVRAGLIYPPDALSNEVLKGVCVKQKMRDLGVRWDSFAFEAVPSNVNFAEFVSYMHNQEKRLKEFVLI